METPELDKEIKVCEHLITNDMDMHTTKARLSEFQAIKARLDNIETFRKDIENHVKEITETDGTVIAVIEINDILSLIDSKKG